MNHVLFYWSIFTIAGSWIIRLVMLWVVIQRKRADTAMGWLVVIFFMPWLGLFLYLLVGENTIPRRRIERYRQHRVRFSALLDRYRSHPSIVRPNLAPSFDATITLAEHLTSLPIVSGNDADIITDTDKAIDCLIDEIDRAQHTVHLMVYIYADDATGNRVGDALIRATGRGVTCRVLIDAVGSRLLGGAAVGERLRAHGVEFHQALPVSIPRFYMARMDLRNHRKIVIIDGRVAYTGSQNIVDAGYGHKDIAWHDIMVRLTGPVVLELQSVFMGDWYAETNTFIEGAGVFAEPSLTGPVTIQTLPSGPTYPTENYQRIVVAAMYAAQREITITTPYFVPDQPFLQALQVAALRGVRVDLIVPERLDQRVVGAASKAYYDDLLETGVHIHTYQPGLLHTKSMLIDESLAFIGTSNFDIRSFSLNFEINLVFYGSEFIERLRDLHNEYRSQSLELDLVSWGARPVQRRVFQHIAKLLSPLL